MESAKTDMHAMIIVLILTYDEHLHVRVLEKSLFKSTITLVDKRYILPVCLIYKVLNGLALPPRQDFIKKNIIYS